MERRKFLKYGLYGGLVVGTGLTPNLVYGAIGKKKKLVILHTNDTHSRVDSFPKDGSRNEGRGGVARRATVVQEVRNAEKNVLLFDCGDILQGTPFFNFFEGDVEIKAMNMMGYSAGTVGNHDFDGGLEVLEKIADMADFPFVSSNYDFSKTPLKDKIKKHHIINIDGLKIGVLGLGISLEGLVPKELYGETVYLDPIQSANETATFLKTKEKCDLVVCLSHLGYNIKGKGASDIVLAPQSKNIDIILGGHTHTFLKEPVVAKNSENKNVLISQVGFGGIWLGRLDLEFSPGKKEWNLKK